MMDLHYKKYHVKFGRQTVVYPSEIFICAINIECNVCKQIKITKIVLSSQMKITQFYNALKIHDHKND